MRQLDNRRLLQYVLRIYERPLVLQLGVLNQDRWMQRRMAETRAGYNIRLE